MKHNFGPGFKQGKSDMPHSNRGTKRTNGGTKSTNSALVAAVYSNQIDPSSGMSIPSPGNGTVGGQLGQGGKG